jgi:hypothetical protein
MPRGIRVLVAGGYSAQGALSSAELYNPAAGHWTAIGGLHAARDAAMATRLADGKVLVAGGYGFLAGAELYTP